MTSSLVNPGRFASVISPGGEFTVERISPRAVQISMQPMPPDAVVASVSDEGAEAMMRALAGVLGFEIGARHEV